MIHVEGSPIDGENPPHEQRWREAIAAAATGIEPAAAVRLHFRLEPHRTVDLDNLVRPALAGLRDAGVFARGYRHLDAILATKASADVDAGVDIDPTTGRRHGRGRSKTAGVGRRAHHPATRRRSPEQAQLARAHSSPATHRRRRRSVGRRRGQHDTVTRSLLKPIIDGLDPLVGADPFASLEFTPNDDRVEWLRISRQPNLPWRSFWRRAPWQTDTTPSPS
jgi:hypothetical protein